MMLYGRVLPLCSRCHQLRRPRVYSPELCTSTSTPRKAINKVLIANRGEITCRIIRTAKRLGIKTVAVFSDADVNSLHVKLADEAVHIGPAPSSQSYLRFEKILQVAADHNVDAVHPGYGFLSENVEFADACTKAGVIFIGPPSSAIKDMGIKSTSKIIMSKADVPVIPGYHGEDQSVGRLRHEANLIGYPVMLKAVRGGGGKGMRIVETESDFENMLQSAKSESLKSFRNDDMLIEKFVVKPRHVEVQVFCDQHGNGVHLFERDCSVQRRHQKIIEEAPAPGLSRDLALELGSVAVKAAQAVKYVGAGTVEFVMDQNFNFYFMEMNTRLQVEHPITEMITGQDLVEWQFRIAEGEHLPLSQDDIRVNGHSFEARIYAEDPSNNFMPGAGKLSLLIPPTPVAGGVRIETGVLQGDEVTVHYDPLIAKLVVWSENRGLALKKLAACLDSYHVLGLRTNIGFLKQLCTHPAFVAGEVHTDFIPDHNNSLFPEDSSSSSSELRKLKIKDLTKACLALIQLRRVVEQSNSCSPWLLLSKFRVNNVATETFKLRNIVSQELATVEVTFKDPNVLIVKHANEELEASIKASYSEDNIRCQIGDHLMSFSASYSSSLLTLWDKSSGLIEWELVPLQQVSANEGSVGSMGDSLKAAIAPMTGIIDKILVKVGNEVKKNQPIVTMTAMKMEYTVKAPCDGIIGTVMFNSGDTVDRHATIIEFVKP